MDLSLDDTHDALRAAVATCCARSDRSSRTGAFDRDLWSRIGDIGVFDLGAPGDGTTLHLAVACLELGRHDVWGPLGGTILARHADIERPLVATVASADGTVPWGPDTDVILSVGDDGSISRCELDDVEVVVSMSGDRWSRGRLRPIGELGNRPSALALAHLSAAAWAVGRAQAVIDAVASYAKDRVQFGRSIGEFQAVAHPLAEAAAALVAGSNGLLTAAWHLDASGVTVPVAAARLAGTKAALNAVLVAHQAFGALGFIEEGPLGMTAMRLRELCTIPPGDLHASAHLAADLLGPPASSSGQSLTERSGERPA